MLARSKSLQQAAALPYVWTDLGLEVALITSRERKRWIIPKGWPQKKRPLREVAAREAREEAGLEGTVAQEPIGSFEYRKMVDKGYRVTCQAFVFPLLVSVQRLRWKERKQRRMRWLPVAEAARLADDPGLARLLAELAANPGLLKTDP